MSLPVHSISDLFIAMFCPGKYKLRNFVLRWDRTGWILKSLDGRWYVPILVVDIHEIAD
jgi:hypothetical protein